MDKELKSYYKKYRDIIIPSVILCTALFIFFKVILSQFSLITDLNTKITDENDQVAKLQTAVDALNASQKGQLDLYLSLTDGALPSTKNILSIFSALNSLAVSSNVSLDSFSLTVGSIYSDGEKNNPQEINPILGTPTVAVNASVGADSARNIIDFSSKLYQIFPLAQIQDLQYSDNRASFDIVFFYKPYDLNFISNSEAILPLTASDVKMLKTLNGWQNTQ